MGAAETGRLTALHGLRQDYDSTSRPWWAQIVSAVPLRLPTGTTHAEPGLLMTYASEQRVVQDR